MTFKDFCKTALLGLALAVSPVVGAAQAETLTIVKRGTAATLNVPMNRAIVVESDEPFAELSIANPGIADISSLSDRTIYVLGKSPGLTTLTLLDATGRLITNVDVRVAADVSEFKERLRQILPGEKIEVRTANDGIVLSGVVSSSQRLQRALDLAERYAPERVSNLMSVGGVQQVMLKVRFAEMQRTVSKSLSSSLAMNGAVFGNNAGLNAGTGTLNNSGAVTNTLGGNIPAVNDNSGAVLFGFNAGSALQANSVAAYAAINSEIAASTAMTVWMVIEWVRFGKPKLVGLCVGAIAGLATVTPAAGFIAPWGAFLRFF